jgi:hypothetical protein
MVRANPYLHKRCAKRRSGERYYLRVPVPAELTEAVRNAEAELDAATARSALKMAAKRLMMARAQLKRAGAVPPPAGSRQADTRSNAAPG